MPAEKLRVHEAARLLGVSPVSLGDCRFRRKHGIPAVRIGRALIFDPRQLQAYLAGRGETFQRHDGTGDDDA